MICICKKTTELNGAEAIEYAQEHLNKIRVDGDSWQIEYECPDTHIRWLMDYPHGELHGGGPPRLRKIST